MNFSHEELQVIWEGLENREKPLTIINDVYTEEHIKEFLAICKATGKKSMTDCSTTLVGGKVADKRCNWTREFQQLACKHFEVANFEDFFTEDGKRGQMVAKELHRIRAKKTNLGRKSGAAATEIAKALHGLSKKAKVYEATITMPKANNFSVSMMGGSRKHKRPMEFAVNADGITEIPTEETHETRSKVNLE